MGIACLEIKDLLVSTCSQKEPGMAGHLKLALELQDDCSGMYSKG